jgi:hypothetical protein
MSDTQDIAAHQRINELSESLRACESLIDFVIACNDASSDGLLAVQKSVQNVNVLIAELVQLDPSAYTESAAQAKSRGEAFLAQHGHSSQ